MLSIENIQKLCMTGLYKCKPNQKYRGSIHWKNMYHCCNWTFRVHKYENEYFMQDTYWNGSDVCIKLTDENFNEFTLIFDFNDVESHSGRNIEDYDSSDYYNEAVDSGGMYCGGKYFIKKGARPVKEKVLKRLQDDIKSAEDDLARAKHQYNQVLSGEVKLEYA